VPNHGAVNPAVAFNAASGRELHQNFERVPDNLTMAGAAALLLKQALIAAKY
jgi:hypothetical protein